MIRGDLCLRDADEVVVYCDQNGHRYDYRKPSQPYPFCGTYDPLPRLPIARGYWVRRESLGEGESVLLRVSKVNFLTFEFDLLYNGEVARKPIEQELRTKSIDLWVTVMAPVLKAKPLVIVKSETRRMTLERKIIRDGWDNITYLDRTAYVRGDILIYQDGDSWHLRSPNPLVSEVLGRSDVLKLMKMVEKWL